MANVAKETAHVLPELPRPSQYGKEIAVLEERVRGLKDLLETQIHGLKDLTNLRAAADKEAVERASEALTLRMDHANGLIAQMKEREKETVRIEIVAALEKRIDMLEGYREHTMGRSMGSNSMADLIFKIFPLLLSSGAFVWAWAK